MGNQYSLVLEIFIRTDKISNILSIGTNKNGDKSAILNLILTQDSWEDCNKCMCKVSEKIFIGVGDIHQDGQISDGRKDGAQIIIPHKKTFFSGG